MPGVCSMLHADARAACALLAAATADVGLARLRRGTYLSEMPTVVGTFAW